MTRYIIGAGAHGRVIADILGSQNLRVDGFLDDDRSLHGTQIADSRVIGGADMLGDVARSGAVELIVALGQAPLRLYLTKQFLDMGHVLINAVHHHAVISPSVSLGRGICVCAGGIVNPDTSIGDAVIINTGATIDHDCQIEEGAHLSPGVHLAGRVRVGRLSFLSTGVAVAPRIRIGPNTIIGAGAVVVEDIPAGVLAMGVPARVVRELTEPIDWRRLL